MAEQIIVIGAGGFGRETLDVIHAINAVGGDTDWSVQGVVDDAPSDPALRLLDGRGCRYLGPLKSLETKMHGQRFVVAIGNSRIRSRIARQLESWGGVPATLIHPRSTIGTRTEVGEGTVVCGGVQISTEVRVGRHSHLNPASIVGHDAVLGDFVSVNPGAIVSGAVRVESGCLIGAGAVVLQGLVLGAGSTVGASACVTRDVQPGETVIGVPARSHARIESEPK